MTHDHTRTPGAQAGDLPQLQDLAHEGRTSADTRLRPVHGEGGLQHDAGAFVRSAQAGTGSDGGGAGSLAGESRDGPSVRLIDGIWHARRIAMNSRVVTGIGFTRERAVADFWQQWNMA